MTQDGNEALLQARDLSLGGALLAPRATDGLSLGAGSWLEVTFTPDEDSPHHAFSDGGATVHAAARVVRSDPNGVAVAFVQIDAENRFRLRALLDLRE